MNILGPCVMCGAKDYPLSMGGPAICPRCDCGFPVHPNEVAKIYSKLRAAETQIEELMAMVSGCEIPIRYVEP